MRVMPVIRRTFSYRLLKKIDQIAARFVACVGHCAVDIKCLDTRLMLDLGHPAQ